MDSQSQCAPRDGPPGAGAAVVAEDLLLAHGPHHALDGASFSIPAAATTALVGPNGAGKSTLLLALAGTHPPAAGRLHVAARRRRGGVGLVLQTTEVDRAVPITVREAVTLARYARLGPFRPLRRADRAAVARALQRLEVADLAGRQLHELSGGQRQRVLVAQGLAQEAELLLLDEPVTGLDLVSRDLILTAVDEEVAAGRTVVMSTHDLRDAARCDHVLLLAGEVVAEGPPAVALAAEHLSAAYGGRVLRLPTGEAVLDDPHPVEAPHRRARR